MASLISINGKLKSMNYVPTDTDERSTGYSEIKVGRPLVIRYLHFHLNFPAAGSKKNEEVMISSFTKANEERGGAAEAINYYNPTSSFVDQHLRITDFGGECYGHELIYYVKSYLGESVRLTTRIMELDDSSKSIKQIARSIEKIGGLPIFAEYLPYVAITKQAVGLLGKLGKIFNRDDPIVPGHDIDLHFKRNHSRKLQSGRVVCVEGKPDSDIVDDYMLDNSNQLVSRNDGAEYTDTTYFVFQVNSERHKLYEKFDHFQGAAELLGKTNRPTGDMGDIVTLVADGLSLASDVEMIDRIDEVEFDLSDKAVRVDAKAMFNAMTPDMKKLYKPVFDKMMSNTPIE